MTASRRCAGVGRCHGGTVPVAVLFSFLQRHLIHGLTAGAVKR
jgi:hypothetical protein